MVLILQAMQTQPAVMVGQVQMVQTADHLLELLLPAQQASPEKSVEWAERHTQAG
jgi:hypothetical protein